MVAKSINQNGVTSGDGAMPPVYALIFAGGTGKRMTGSSRPKQFLELSGKPIIGYTLDIFAFHPMITGITIVCLESWIGYMERYLTRKKYPVPVNVIPGKDTGQGSRMTGLDYLYGLHSNEDAVVLVHDGVRPLVDQATVAACIESVLRFGPTVTVAPSTETVMELSETGEVKGVIDRSVCALGRAPQAFQLDELWMLYKRAESEGKDFVDSISLTSHYGLPAFTVEGPPENIKVTTPMDYYAFKAYMEARDQQKVWGD